MGAKSPDRSPATVQHVYLELDSVIKGLTVAERAKTEYVKQFYYDDSV